MKIILSIIEHKGITAGLEKYGVCYSNKAYTKDYPIRYTNTITPAMKKFMEQAKITEYQYTRYWD